MGLLTNLLGTAIGAIFGFGFLYACYAGWPVIEGVVKQILSALRRR